MRHFAAFLLAILLPLLAVASPAPDDIVIVAAKGDVQVTSGGATQGARVGSTLDLPAAIRTGADGSIDLRQGETTIGIGPDSQLDFPAPAAGVGAIDRVVQPGGNAYYSVGPRGKNRLRVETPYLVAVIKGTQFNVAVTPDSSTISLHEGRLEVLATEAGIAAVELNAGEVAIRRRGEKAIRVLQVKNGAAPSTASTGTNDDDDGDAGTVTALVPTGKGGQDPEVPGDGSPLAGDVDEVFVPVDGGVTVDVDVNVDGAGGTPVGVDASLEGGIDLGAGIVDAGVDAGIELGPVGADASADVGVDLGAGTVNAGVDAGVDLGPASVDTGLDAGVDLGAGTVNVAADAGVDLGPAGVDVAADAGADLGAGTVDAGVDAGVDLGAGVDADLGADAGVDAGAGTIDASVDAGVAGADVGVDVGVDLTGPDAGLDIGVDVLGTGIDLGLGAMRRKRRQRRSGSRQFRGPAGRNPWRPSGLASRCATCAVTAGGSPPSPRSRWRFFSGLSDCSRPLNSLRLTRARGCSRMRSNPTSSSSASTRGVLQRSIAGPGRGVITPDLIDRLVGGHGPRRVFFDIDFSTPSNALDDARARIGASSTGNRSTDRPAGVLPGRDRRGSIVRSSPGR